MIAHSSGLAPAAQPKRSHMTDGSPESTTLAPVVPPGDGGLWRRRRGRDGKATGEQSWKIGNSGGTTVDYSNATNALFKEATI